MAYPGLHPRVLLVFSLLSLFTCSMPASAQSGASAEHSRSSTAVSDNNLAESSSLTGPGFYGTGSDLVVNSSNKELPEAPYTATSGVSMGGSTERYDSTPGGVK